MEEHRVHGGSSVHLTLRILQPSQARLPILRRGRADMSSSLSLQRVDPLAGLFRGQRVRKQSSTPARQHCATQEPEDLLCHPRGPSLCCVRQARTSQSGFVGNVVIRYSDEMPGNGQVAESLTETKSAYHRQLDGWMGWSRGPSRNDPLDPVTPDSRAGPVLAPFRSTIESCISAVLLWAVAGPTLRPCGGCP